MRALQENQEVFLGQIQRFPDHISQLTPPHLPSALSTTTSLEEPVWHHQRKPCWRQMGWTSATRVTGRRAVGMPIPIPPELTPHTRQPSPEPLLPELRRGAHGSQTYVTWGFYLLISPSLRYLKRRAMGVGVAGLKTLCELWERLWISKLSLLLPPNSRFTPLGSGSDAACILVSILAIRDLSLSGLEASTSCFLNMMATEPPHPTPPWLLPTSPTVWPGVMHPANTCLMENGSELQGDSSLGEKVLILF